MRAQCSICSDLFEDGSESSISAASCGHTFHETCLLQWLDKSGTSTCPHCRVFVNRDRIISKLYFNVADAVEFADDDPSKLINEIHNLKVKLKQAEKEKNRAEQAKDEEKAKAVGLVETNENLTQVLLQEQQTSLLLRKQLEQHQRQQREVEEERKTFKAARQRVKELEEVTVLLNESESDASSIFDQYGERGGRELSKYCAILKREYEGVKRDKRALREELEGLRKVSAARGRSVKALTEEVAVLRRQIHKLEEDLGTAESERDTLRQRLKAMRRAIIAPKDSSSSLVEKWDAGSPSSRQAMSAAATPPPSQQSPMELSPAKTSALADVVVISPVKKIPKISVSPHKRVKSQLFSRQQETKRVGSYMDIDDENFDRAIATKPKPSLTADADVISDEEMPSLSQQGISQENKKSLIVSSKSKSANSFKYSSDALSKLRAAGSQSSLQKGLKASERDDDAESIAALGNMNLFKKRVPGTDYFSNIRKGYDGMGGHTVFTQASRQFRSQVPSKPKAGSSKGKAKMPPLPSLHGFFS